MLKELLDYGMDVNLCNRHELPALIPQPNSVPLKRSKKSWNVVEAPFLPPGSLEVLSSLCCRFQRRR